MFPQICQTNTNIMHHSSNVLSNTQKLFQVCHITHLCFYCSVLLRWVRGRHHIRWDIPIHLIRCDYALHLQVQNQSWQQAEVLWIMHFWINVYASVRAGTKSKLAASGGFVNNAVLDWCVCFCACRYKIKVGSKRRFVNNTVLDWCVCLRLQVQNQAKQQAGVCE